ncbi:MAG: MBL fold metallo-hydrolase [Firmicutes bacterium]|nr:MBL fold metallo-hydrolase [Bacillota bacterium]
MKITVLVENTTKNPKLKQKHGLSLYIETNTNKILFDLGPDETYLYNAKQLGIDLTEIDTVILSHGHCDHGGALLGFLKFNDKAKIYVSKKAFEQYYIKVLFAKVYVGLDRSLIGSERFILTDDTMQIDDELFLFSDVDGHFRTKSNNVLLAKTQSGYVQDDFYHEQNLIVTEKDKAVLFSGCSHRGIANIVRTAHKHQPLIQAVFGGFHLYNPVAKTTEPVAVTHQLAKELSAYETVYYTGHCTGNKAFKIMQNIMGDKVQHLSTGSVFERN